MNLESFYEAERIRVAKNYKKTKHQGFTDKNDLANWFVVELIRNNCTCYYCETAIHDIVKLIESGKLKERKIGFGFRGRVLEIDKNDEYYTRDHCVLSCYYCNNDKSYTTSKEDYKKFFGENRKKYFELLLKSLEAEKT